MPRFRPLPVLVALLLPLALAPARAPAQAAKAAPARVLGTTSDEARSRFTAGLDDACNGFDARAAERLEEALAADPKYGLARALHAVVAPGLTAEQRAAELDRAVAEAAAGPPVEVLEVLAWRSDDSAERRALYRSLTELAPAEPRFALALAALETEPDALVQALKAVAQRFADFAPARNRLAYALRDAGDRDAAMHEAQEYVRLAPGHPHSHASYAELLQWSKRYDEALEHYQKSLELAPHYARAYAGIAEVRQLAGRYAEARAAWQQAIDRSPAASRWDLAVRSAGSHLLEGNRKPALAALVEAARLADAAANRSQAGQAHALMAVVEGSGGDWRALDADLEQATRIAPDDPRVTGLAAIAHAGAGHVAEARAAARFLASAAARGSADLKSFSHVVNAIVAAAADDVPTAQTELKYRVSDDAIGKAFVAEALRRAGDREEARALRDEILGGPEVSFLGDVARMRVKKL
ncbi:MAG TPA: tetratricopeptide repeat protein [Longimicrobiales bacterium]|nr:tetratricopeptide repeat protein [Longimicrobiales bacterium]